MDERMTFKPVRFRDSSFYRALIHIPHGFFIVWAGELLSPHYSWIFFIGFIIYQLTQHFIIGDGAYKDIKGSLYGIVLGAVLFCAFS